MAFQISPELQAMIAGFQGNSVANVAINQGFDTSVETFPSNPAARRFALVFSVSDGTQYNANISNLDGSSPFVITLPR